MPRKTDTRENILDFIRAFRRENGYSPSVREVARHCGIKSPSVVQYHLDQLEQTGLITREEYLSSVNDALMFLVYLIPLAYFWARITQKTDTVLGSVLFHAGTDVSVILVLLSQLS